MGLNAIYRCHPLPIDDPLVELCLLALLDFPTHKHPPHGSKVRYVVKSATLSAMSTQKVLRNLRG